METVIDLDSSFLPFLDAPGELLFVHHPVSTKRQKAIVYLYELSLSYPLSTPLPL